MVYMRDNFGRFQKQATINLTKKLQKKADDAMVNIRQVVADELLKKYKENVWSSYGVRSSANASYVHTDTFIDSIDVEIDKNKVRIVLDEDARYDNGRTVGQVHKYLTEGTKGEGEYVFRDENNFWKTAYNYPTPKHLFEEHTMEQMKGFLTGLNIKDYMK